MAKSPEGTGFLEHLKPDKKLLHNLGSLALLGIVIYAIGSNIES